MTSAAVRRPVRTGIQSGAGWLLVTVVTAFGVDLTAEQTAALVAVLTPLIAWLQVTIEDAVGKGVLRDVPGRHELGTGD